VTPPEHTDDLGRLCAWCGRPVPAGVRRDARCCSKRCRQAQHRFRHGAGQAIALADQPLRLAYADPPYPGNAWLYRGHIDYAGEVDHAALIERLMGYDGWALSTSAKALPAVLRLCPAGVRVAAWHRGPRPTPSWHPLNAWEPVIYQPARPVDTAHAAGRRVDSLICGVTPVTTRPGRVIGAKPAPFCRWVFDLVGAAAGDSLDDLFPGSGAVGRAWALYTTRADVVCRPGDASPTAVPDTSRSGVGDASRTPGRDPSPAGPRDTSIVDSQPHRRTA
jgi:hypothetical protein